MNREDWIGAYLAGALRGDKLKDFEKQLKNDPVLQVEVDAVKSFINTVDDEKDFPVVLEIIKETDNAFNEQPSKTELLKIVGLIVGVVLLIILSLFFLNKNDSTDEVVINNETVYAANFKDFINDKYEDNAHFLDVNSNRGGRAVEIDSLLKIIFTKTDTLAREGDWDEVDRLLSEEMPNMTLSNYEQDVISFIGGLARLQIDSCDALGQERLSAIPKRSFYNFFPVSREILNRVEEIDCPSTRKDQ